MTEAQPKGDDFSESFSEFAKGAEPDANEVDDELDGSPETPEGEAGEQEQEVRAENGEAKDEDQNIWEGLSESQMQALRKLEAERNDFRHRATSESGRTAALQRKLNEIEVARQQAPPQQAAQKAATQQQPETDEEKRWAEFREEYPELAQTMEAKLARERAEMREELRHSMAPVAQRIQGLGEAEYERYLDRQEEALKSEHSDWEDVATSREFSEWLSVIPRSVASMAQSDDASEISYLISSFKRDIGKAQQPSGDGESSRVSALKQERRQRLEQSQEPPASRSTGQQPIPQDDFNSAFAAFASREERRRKRQ